MTCVLIRAGPLLSLSPSGKLRMCPLMRGAFFRAIWRCVCEYGGLAALSASQLLRWTGIVAKSRYS